ncbi:MAG: cell division protein SepF [Defluviitaleaceae bacterium]|nr:cell division protein SepF [Defluviitaleaceae bacterium]
MGIFQSVKNFVFQKGYDDDEYLYDDEYEIEEEDRYTPTMRERSADVAYIDSRSSYTRESERSRNSDYKRGDTVEFSTSKASSPAKTGENKIYTVPMAELLQIVISEPTCFDDAPAVCDLLRQRKPVVVNMEAVGDVKEAQRIMDFMAGVVYSINGDIQPVTNRIYIVTPENVNVSDHTREHLKANGIFSTFKTAFGGR